MPKTKTMTLRVDERMKERLASVAASQRRSASFIAHEAIEDYLRVQEAQMAGIRQAIEAADTGETIAGDEVRAWVESWGGPGERSKPKA